MKPMIPDLVHGGREEDARYSPGETYGGSTQSWTRSSRSILVMTDFSQTPGQVAEQGSGPGLPRGQTGRTRHFPPLALGLPLSITTALGRFGDHSEVTSPSQYVDDGGTSRPGALLDS